MAIGDKYNQTPAHFIGGGAMGFPTPASADSDEQEQEQQDPCFHCPGHVHKVRCSCNHTHNQHVFAGPCIICACNGYDQRKVALI
jgi:hypothetical protein